MRVEFSKPPGDIYDRCAAQFTLPAGKTIYFAYGDTIYVVGQTAPGPAILAHEAVHGGQQAELQAEVACHAPISGIVEWWDRYLASAEYRLEQELPAHAAELACLLRSMHNRAGRREAISIIAGKLSAPMYGNLISKDRAKSELLKRVDALLKDD